MRKLIFIQNNEEYYATQTGDFASGEILKVNETGYEILSFMEQGKTNEEIVQIYKERFQDVPQVGEDIRRFCEQLRTVLGEKTIDNESTGDTVNKSVSDSIYGTIQTSYCEQNKPFRVFLELTYHCNLKCPHCYVQEDITKDGNFIEKEKVFCLIEQLEESGVMELNITGGECSLHPDFIEILHYATAKNMKVTVLTNGQMIAQNHLVEQLLDCPLSDVRVSIYGTREYHNQFVGMSNAFERSVQTLKELQEKKGIGKATFIATNENIQYLDELKKEFSELGIPIVISPIIMPTTHGDSSPTRYRLGRVALKKLVKDNDMILTGASCSAGRSRFRITPDGRVNPCEMIRDVSFGNVYETSFQEVMEGEKRKQWIQGFTQILKEHSCNQCSLRPRCNMCPGLFYTENGSFQKPSPFLCVYASVREEISRE